MNPFISKRKPIPLATLVAVALLVGCGSGANDNVDTNANDADAGHQELDGGHDDVPLPAQTGQRSALFYGNTNYRKLGALTNARVIDPSAPDAVLVSSDDVMATSTGRPQPSATVVGYDAATGSYADLFVDSLYYVKAGSPKRVSMTFMHDMETHSDIGPEERAHSNATGLTSPSYAEINYLGTTRMLTATDAQGGKVIICPTATGGEIAIPFANKTFLTLWYASYGERPSAAVVFDTSTFAFQKMVPPSEACEACNEPGTELSYTDFAGPTMTASSKYAFLGDLTDTATSAVVVDGRLYVMDKAALTLTEKAVTPTGTAVTFADLLGATGKAVSKLSGNSVFYLYKGADQVTNLYRVDVTTGALTQVTAGHGDAHTPPTKIHSVTDDWVVYGTDGLMLAARKSAVGSVPVLLAENTRTSGIRYPFNFGIGSQYLFVKYRLDVTSGHTTYEACVFKADGTTGCRKDSFWAGVSAARQGTLNFTSDYPYTPYAFVRVDDTDDFGGGTLKAVDPASPLDDGFAVGSVPRYNFNTFLHAHHYLKTTVDTDGWIIVYGKSDETFVGDAFLLNLRQKNSVKNVTTEAVPSTGELTGGDLHCHGRPCAVCHNFAGGKIYGNAAGSVETTGYAVKLAFEDGSSATSRSAKGKGENFSFLYEAIKGDFTPIIVTADGKTEIKRGQHLGHSGLASTNCNHCHARDTLRHGAPAVINIAP